MIREMDEEVQGVTEGQRRRHYRRLVANVEVGPLEAVAVSRAVSECRRLVWVGSCGCSCKTISMDLIPSLRSQSFGLTNKVILSVSPQGTLDNDYQFNLSFDSLSFFCFDDHD